MSTHSKCAAHPSISVFRAIFQTFAILCLLLASSAAQAQNVSCTCRYKGQDYGLGESICLKGSDGMHMATCAMVLNNTSWEFSNAPCPLSRWNGSTIPFDRNTAAPDSKQPPSRTLVARPS